MINLTQGMVGKRIRITKFDGVVFEGNCCGYTSANDNVPEVESIDLLYDENPNEGIEIFVNEIKKLEITRNERISV